jgi:hypothetical protein
MPSERKKAPPAPDHRDDLETFAPSDDARTGFPFGSILNVPSKSNCRVSSLCQSVDAKGGEKAEDDVSSPLNNTRMDLEEERLDLNSVLSGTMNDEQTAPMADESNAVSVKNLSRLFEENDEANRRINASSNRPPLAPPKANLKTEEGTAPNNSEEDKLLSVYLRIRPPVSDGKDPDGSISTIEVLADRTNNGLPSTIRTYPPLSSNAAKVVRTNNKLAPPPPKNSKSLNDDGSSDSGTEGEVLGVKEYAYSGVFGPNSNQQEIYESIAKPMVEGLFPEDGRGELGESALLFTLGVTNAGKT